MTSLSEDELRDALSWSEDSYPLATFIDEFQLPQVVKVVRGHDGGTDCTTLGYGEVLTLHALRETQVLAAEDSNGNAISVVLDYPKELQLLPQTKDCSLNSCGFTDLCSLYPTIKYIEVIQAHYGSAEDVDSTSVGDVLEILDISKPHKPEKAKVQVHSLERNQSSMLTSTCTARFRPLLDCKTYKAPDLKTHKFGFPVRVRFMDDEVDAIDDLDYHRLISKNPDINVIDEVVDILVITTSVSSKSEFKFCFEIPKNLEIKVAVAEGFLSGAKHYTDIVGNLNERFDVSRFITSHQPAPVKQRDVIKRYDYALIKKFIVDKSTSPQRYDDVKQDEDAPALPPRPILKKALTQSQSFDVPPPTKEQRRKISEPSYGNITEMPRPPVPARDRSRPQNSILDSDSSTEPTPSVKRDDNISAGESSQTKRNGPNSKPSKPKPPPRFSPNGKDSNPVASSDSSQTTNNLPNTPSHGEEKNGWHEKSQERRPLPRPLSIEQETYSTPPIASPAYSTTLNNLPSVPSQPMRKENWENVRGNNSVTRHPQGHQVRPILPQKSPKLLPKRLVGSQQVLPVSPRVQKKPVVSPGRVQPTVTHPVFPFIPYNAPMTPPCPRHTLIDKGLSRRSTLPRGFKFDENPYMVPHDATQTLGSSTSDKEDEESIYDEPVTDEISRAKMFSKSSIIEDDPYVFVTNIPQDISGLSTIDITTVLRILHMGEYVERFEEEMIDGTLLKALKEDDLESLQMIKVHRTKLLKFIDGWRPNVGFRRAGQQNI